MMTLTTANQVEVQRDPAGVALAMIILLRFAGRMDKTDLFKLLNAYL